MQEPEPSRGSSDPKLPDPEQISKREPMVYINLSHTEELLELLEFLHKDERLNDLVNSVENPPPPAELSPEQVTAQENVLQQNAARLEHLKKHFKLTRDPNNQKNIMGVEFTFDEVKELFRGLDTGALHLRPQREHLLNWVVQQLRQENEFVRNTGTLRTVGQRDLLMPHVVTQLRDKLSHFAEDMAEPLQRHQDIMLFVKDMMAILSQKIYREGMITKFKLDEFQQTIEGYDTDIRAFFSNPDNAAALQKHIDTLNPEQRINVQQDVFMKILAMLPPAEPPEQPTT